MYLIAFAYHLRVGFAGRFKRMFIFVDIKDFYLFIFNQFSRNSLRIMRFADSWKIEDKLHFIAADIK
ncbi:hypothetical protein D9M68_534500 [compost metagenome]